MVLGFPGQPNTVVSILKRYGLSNHISGYLLLWFDYLDFFGMINITELLDKIVQFM